jgi:hypothetical protein
MNRNFLAQRYSGDAVFAQQAGAILYDGAAQAANTITAAGTVYWDATFTFTLPSSLFSLSGEMALTGDVVGSATLTQDAQTLTANGLVSPFGSIFASLNALQDDNTLAMTAAASSARTIHLTFRNGFGGEVDPATFKYAFWDSALPDILTAPTASGTGTIGSDGTATIEIDQSLLPSGGVGYLVMSDTDGDPDTPWKQHSGPVRVE